MSAAYPAGLVGTHGETLALSTTVASLGIPLGAQQAIVYVPTSDFRLAANPALVAAAFYDASASSGARYKQDGGTGPSLWYDLSDRTQVGAGGTGTLLDSATTSDFLYLCFSEPVSGIHIVIGAANATSNTMAGAYRQNDDSWQTISLTDATDTGASLAATGTVIWTAVTDWKATSLYDIEVLADTNPKDELPYKDAPRKNGYWLRLSWDVALDSDTEISDIWALNYGTTRGYYRAGVEYALSFDRRVVGAVEAILASSTATMDITWVKV
jgi:hypothetical protein